MVLRRSSSIKKLILSIAVLVLLSPLSALNVPALNRRVTDNAGIMNQNDINTLESYLENLENNTSIQIAVLTIKSLEGEDLASYSMKVCETWKLGQSGKDNGALLLVAYDERKVRIEVGYGLEGDLTDTKCGLIIRNVIIPEFKNGNYSRGIVQGVKNMGGIVAGEVEYVDKTVTHEVDETGSPFAVIGMLFGHFHWSDDIKLNVKKTIALVSEIVGYTAGSIVFGISLLIEDIVPCALWVITSEIKVRE